MARPGTRKIQRYTAEFKIKAVKLTQIDNIQVKDVTEALDIHPFMLSRWRKEGADGLIQLPRKPDPTPTRSRTSAVHQAQAGTCTAKQEHELLKQAIRFCSEQRSGSTFIRAEQDRFGVAQLSVGM